MSLRRDVAAHGAPNNWHFTFCDAISQAVFELKDIKSYPRLYFRVLEDMSITIVSRDLEVVRPYPERVKSYQILNRLLIHFSKLRICLGTGLPDLTRSSECKITIDPCDIPANNHGDRRCRQCAAERYRHQNAECKRRKRKTLKHDKDVERRAEFKKMKKEHSENVAELEKLKKELENARVAVANADGRALEEAIRVLPEAQQEAVRACFAASKVDDPRGNRYTLNWIYHCLLLRIKSRALYDNMRRNKILALPNPNTLNNYLKNLQCGYGFQESLFECLKEKSSYMPNIERRGVLLIDEMKLSENISFDAKTMTFRGFTDLGDYTPDKKKDHVGDHALVLMFQPFCGTWVQTIGCFLSNGSANGETLQKLIIDAVALMERSGFFIDAITTDGASWNRYMWKLFHVGEYLEDNNKVLHASCQHPFDENRRLWFISDFPHLIKTLRNWIVKEKKFTTSDGIVDIQHWRNILIHEPADNSSLKSAPMLSESHLNPRGYQKMNVPMAFQLFCPKVQVAMKKYTPHDSEATVTLCKRMDNLIGAMMSHCPKNALYKDGSCRKAITDFEAFLAKWETTCQTATPRRQCLTNETLLGLKVTLRATIELSDFLYECHSHDYLMTARLNQDALERFFGIMQSACGCNDHPNALQFAQLYRLLCVYSLVKPPKNSNISGSEILHTLMTANNLSKTVPESIKDKFLRLLDKQLDNLEYISDDNRNTLNEEDTQYNDLSPQPESDHNYTVQNTSDDIQSYVAGYVARRVSRYTKCTQCIAHCRSSRPQNRNVMIKELSFGYLLYPSNNLFKLTKDIENIVQRIMSKSTVQHDTILRIFDAVHEEVKKFVLVGCKDHCHALTSKIIYFYLTIRGHFLADFFNRKNEAKQKQTQQLRKMAKLK